MKSSPTVWSTIWASNTKAIKITATKTMKMMTTRMMTTELARKKRKRSQVRSQRASQRARTRSKPQRPKKNLSAKTNDSQSTHPSHPTAYQNNLSIILTCCNQNPPIGQTTNPCRHLQKCCLFASTTQSPWTFRISCSSRNTNSSDTSSNYWSLNVVKSPNASSSTQKYRKPSM